MAPPTTPPSTSSDASTAAPNKDFDTELRVFAYPPVLRICGGRVDDEGWLRKYVEYDIEVMYNNCTWRVEVQKSTVNALWFHIKTHLINPPVVSGLHGEFEDRRSNEHASEWPSMKKFFVASAEHSVRPDMMTLVEPYLTAVMHVPVLLHSAFVASMLQVSATTFDENERGRTSKREGWLKARFWLKTKNANSKAMESRWVVLRSSSIALYVTIKDTDAIEALLFDPQLILKRGTDAAGSKKTLLVSNAQFSLQLEANTKHQMQTWANAIAKAFATSEWSKHHRNGSFAIPRSPTEYPSTAQWFVDGKDAYLSIYEALLSAKKQIFIAGWWICPTIHLLRPAAQYPESRLDLVLKKKAEEGIKVYVLMYKEVAVALTLNSYFSKQILNKLHANVNVLRDPDFLLKHFGLWSHHEKIVSVDQNISFVGGLDLCFGRWDTHNHVLFDGPEPEFVGKDYSNPRVKDFVELHKPDLDLIDRAVVPRMPWHDCHCRLEGQPARDVARHFIQRWNYSVSNRRKASTLYHLVPKSNYESFVESEPTEGALTSTQDGKVRDQKNYHLRGFPCTAQILRSISEWSGGCTTERSIQDSYLWLIDSAKHFVYIENQFFVSGLDGDKECMNRIAQALVTRICRAAANGENFRVMVVMPLLPAFPGKPDDDEASSLRGVMHWQYRSISRGEHSIYHVLSQSLPAGVDANSFISFYGLRTHSKNLLTNPDEPVTEQVYVHSKVMIVDDRYAIIGSANVNERSMNGDRDSEIAVLVEDTELDSTIGLALDTSPVGKFCHSFRMRLFEEHFGVSPGTAQYELYADPVDRSAWHAMQQHAAKNAKIYDAVFGCLPSDNVTSFKQIPVPIIEPAKERSSSIAEAAKTIGNWFKFGGTKHDTRSTSESVVECRTLPQTDSPSSSDDELDSQPIGGMVSHYQPIGRPEFNRQTSLTAAMTVNLRDSSQIIVQKDELRDVQGQIVAFPMEFLSDEDLRPKFLPADLFQ